MFPYPSGAGLHVGHPLGYIASDIFARYKKLKDLMSCTQWDMILLAYQQNSMCLQTGIHPEVATKKNTDRYRVQLDKLGFSYDWDREIQTSDPNYYKWTQWILNSFLIHIIVMKEIKQCQFQTLSQTLRKAEICKLMQFVMKTH